MASQILDVQARINDQIRQHQQGFILYWPGDEFVEVGGRRPSYNGIDYWIPPDGPAFDPRTGDAREFDGTLVITDRWGIDPKTVADTIAAYGNNRRAAIDACRALTPNKVFEPANEIISFLISKLGERGLCLLSGDQQTDDLLKKRARDKYLNWKFKMAQDVVGQHRKQNAEFRRNNPGVQPPSAPAKVQELQRFLDRHRAGLIGHKPFVCKHGDGFEYDLAEDLKIHYQASHTADAMAEAGDAAIEALGDAPDAGDRLEIPGEVELEIPRDLAPGTSKRGRRGKGGAHRE